MKSISLSQGRETLVDDSDFGRVSAFKWSLQKVAHGEYAKRRAKINGGWTTVLLHRFILEAGPGEQVDHKNGSGLDNRRENLRIGSKQQNARGFRTKSSGKSSSYRGVSWNANAKKWVAYLHPLGRSKHLGYFDSEEAAARAYDAAALECFGEFACPNFRQVA